MKLYRTVLTAYLLIIAASPFAFSSPRRIPGNKEKISQWNFLPEVLAEVDGRKITKKQFLEKLDKITGGQKLPQNFSREKLQEIARRTVSEMVDNTVWAIILEKEGFLPSPGKVKTQIKNTIRELDPKQLASFKAHIQRKGYSSIDEYSRKMSLDPDAQLDAARDLWIKQKILPRIKSEKNEKRTDKNKNSEKDEKRIVYHILIKHRSEDSNYARNKAAEIMKKLQEGEDFSFLAKTESECPSGQFSGGKLGEYSEKDKMISEIKSAVFSMKTGEYKIVRTKHGYHILKSEPLKPDSDAKSNSNQGIINKKLMKELKKILDNEKSGLNIKIYI